MQAVAVLALLLTVAMPAFTADRLSISLGDLDSADWHASDIELELGLSRDGDQYRIRIGELRHPALPEPVRSFTYHCRSGAITNDSIICDDGLASLQAGALKQRDLKIRINWNIDLQLIDLNIKNIKISKGTAAVDLRMEKTRWKLSATASKIDPAHLGDTIPALKGIIGNLNLSARADLKAVAQGEGGQPSSVTIKADYRNLSFSTPTGDFLGEGLSGQWQGTATATQGGWRGRQQLHLASGEMLTPHFYLAATQQPVDFISEFDYRSRPGRLRLENLRLEHRDLFSLLGAAEWTIDQGFQLTALKLSSPPSSLSHLFNAYLLPVLTPPSLQHLTLDGRIGFDLEFGKERSDLNVTLQDTAFRQGGENGQQLALEGVDADLHWSSLASAPESRFSWRAGHLFEQITLGPAVLRLRIAERRLSLLEEATIGILDGSLRAERFELEEREKGPRITFQGYLTPISMQTISQALDWPPLSGQLSGMIPAISYEAGLITVDGMALVKLFGGQILVKNLQLDGLFGALPALTADLEMKNIDLETLTRTFSFGKITGKLDGQVDNLRMEAWAPVSFDARFATPEDDKTRHRISQKAVDNISNLGGSGVSGAISRSFLRFFEEFGYDRLGISCRLQHEICYMDGVEQAERGYYLVKGGGIPRIDIMGFNRKTDWPLLVSKLKQIASGGTPVIE